MTKLTELVLEYQRTGNGYERLRSEIERFVYYYPPTRPGFCEEDSAEFLLYFREKIPTLMARYVHQDRSFDAYLAKTLRRQLRSFARIRRRQLRMYQLTRAPDLWEEFIAEAAPTGMQEPALDLESCRVLTAPGRRGPRLSVSRRLVVLALKTAYIISDSQVRAVAEATGFSYSWLIACRDELRRDVTTREARRRRLRRRRNEAFVRVRIAQDELSRTVHRKRRETLKAEIAHYSQRLESARRLLSRVPLLPTNEEVARVLGIPKGTVDSTLHHMKHRVKRPSGRDTTREDMEKPR